MKKFNISNRHWTDYGIYEGQTKAQALCAMHTDAGYNVSVDEDDELVFECQEDRGLCGDVDAWVLEEVLDEEALDE